MDLEQDIYEFLSLSERAYGKIYPEAVVVIRKYIAEAQQAGETCPVCKGDGVFGRGSMVENKCSKCKGTGKCQK